MERRVERIIRRAAIDAEGERYVDQFLDMVRIIASSTESDEHGSILFGRMLLDLAGHQPRFFAGLVQDFSDPSDENVAELAQMLTEAIRSEAIDESS